MSGEWTPRVHTYTCRVCGFEFDHLVMGSSRRTMCDDCRREQRSRVRKATNQRRLTEAGTAPIRTLGNYDMAAELTRLRIVVEMIGPLMRTGQFDKALALLYYGQAPTRL